MNIFSSFGSQLFRGSVSTNSESYINKQNVNVTLDPSGTDFIEYSSNSNYFHDAHGININNEDTTSLILNQLSTPLSLSSLDEFTIYMKYKVHDNFSKPLLGHIYTDPNYEVILSDQPPFVGNIFTVTVLNGSDDNIYYTISGDFTSANLDNADMSGVLTDIESTLTYTLISGTGLFNFIIDNTDVSASFNIHGWVLVFRQHRYLWTTDPEINSLNDGDPTNDNYSVLNNIDDFKDVDGKFHFKYQSYNMGNMDATLNAQIWKQAISPFYGTHPVSNSGYTAIHVDNTVDDTVFNGLFKQGSSSDPYPNHPQTYLDCTSNNSWWYPVAAKSYSSETLFPTVQRNPTSHRDTIELWAYT